MPASSRACFRLRFPVPRLKARSAKAVRSTATYLRLRVMGSPPVVLLRGVAAGRRVTRPSGAAGAAEVKRLVDLCFWLVKPLLARTGDRRGPGADVALLRFLAWRRSMLLVVLLCTALTAALDTTTRLVEGPRLSSTLLIRLEPEAGPVEQTWFGDLADLLWLLSFYAMPASALLAAAFWARPRVSRSVLLAGWVASFLVPVAIALTPWSWWNVEPPPPATPGARLARQ